MNKAGDSLSTWLRHFLAVSPLAGVHQVIRCSGFRCFDAVEEQLPRQGRILDLGCGYGLFPILMGQRQAGREVMGIDLLEERLEIGRRVLRRAGGPTNVSLVSGDISDPPPGPFAAITVSDVLFYHPFDAQLRILDRCRQRLVPGGLLVITEQTRRPAWKARLVALQERLVVGSKLLFGSRGWQAIAPQASVFLWEEDDLDAALAARGLRVTRRPLHRGSYLSHHLFTAAAPQTLEPAADGGDPPPLRPASPPPGR